MIVYIYGFIHKKTGEWWYVGLTNDCVSRWGSHKKCIVGNGKRVGLFHKTAGKMHAWNDIEMRVIDLIEVEEGIDWKNDFRCCYLEKCWMNILGAKYNSAKRVFFYSGKNQPIRVCWCGRPCHYVNGDLCFKQEYCACVLPTLL
jgi:hypothetical protein